jgi:NAD(P)-dependent dehydrogenase (short-subunit alcohol dehydrogenase family)
MTGLLAGRRVIVTGGSNGIGAACVAAFAREGARVVSVDIDDARGKAVSQAAGSLASYLHCDVTRRAEVTRVFEHAAQELGGLDVLIHTAGIEAAMPAERITDEEWDRVFDIHVRGTLHTNQVAFELIRGTIAASSVGAPKPGSGAVARGRIVNFGSGAGIRGQKGSAHYSAAKGAVMAWTRTVAQEWGPHGITVNAVVPAAWTGQYESHRARMAPEQLAAHDAQMARTIPLGGKLGDALHDIAPAVVFLASDASHFMSGQCVAIDGGMVLLGS